jgi:acetyltransferase-like isoleucine patch superfamily enzyme
MLCQMIAKYGAKLRKAVWLILIRVVGQINPRFGTGVAIAFYTRSGMNMAGRPTFISFNAWFDGSKNYGLITLHEGCNISRDVRVLTHDWSPYTAFRSLGRQSTAPIGRLLPVEVGPHAFIGLGVILLPGATIGRGAIIGAGTVVRGKVDDYAIAIGNPMQIVGDARDYVKQKYPDEWAVLHGE